MKITVPHKVEIIQLALKSHCIHYAPYYKLYDQVHNMAGAETEKNCNISFAFFLSCHVIWAWVLGKKITITILGATLFKTQTETENNLLFEI